MKQIIFVGFSGLGIELASQAKGDVAAWRDWIPYGFLDSRIEKGNKIDGFTYLRSLGDPAHYPVDTDIEQYIISVANPFAKERYTEMLIQKGAIFISLKTNVVIAESAAEGVGIIYGIESRISDHCNLGNFVHIGCRTQIGHGVRIGDFSHIGPACFIAGNVEIGKHVIIHPNSSIAAGVTIGSGAEIGIGSVVLRDVAPNTVVLGNPAKTIRAL